jgi:hypothetical protein
LLRFFCEIRTVRNQTRTKGSELGQHPFPSELSEESYEELKAQLELFLRRHRLRARQRLEEKVIRDVLASKKDEAAN